MFTRRKRRLALVYVSLLTSLLLPDLLGATVVHAQIPSQSNAGGNQILLPLITGGGLTSQNTIEQQALALVAAQNQLEVGDLAVIHSTQVEYPLTNQSGQQFKVMDRTGTLFEVMLDANGQAMNAAQAVAAEEAAYSATYGRVEPALADALTRVAAAGTLSTSLDVIVWLNMPEYIGPDRPALHNIDVVTDEVMLAEVSLSEAELTNRALAQSGQASDTLVVEPGMEEADVEVSAAVDVQADLASQAAQEQQTVFLAQVDVQRANAVAQVIEPLVSRLQSLGAVVTVDTHAPVLYAQLTPEEIQEVARWDEVSQIYLDQPMEPQLEIGRQTVYAHTVNSRGITGSGVRVAQIEVGGRVATNNPYLSGIVQDTNSVCASPNAHATGVAGILRSTHSSRRGLAPGITLWAGGVCPGADGTAPMAQLQSRATAAVNWGARILNLSYGANANGIVGASERFYDNLVINHYRTIVVSAGNNGSGCGGNGYIGSPASAYNVLTVGNFDDKNSVTWSGDTMSTCSSWRDPISTHGDREKPEISASGTTINSTTNASPWTGNIGSGTSFSAPMVAAGAALLMQRNSALTAWPEAVKAILMASALHNIEGAARLSEYDGAGGISLDWADDIARRVNGNWGAQAYSCSTASTLDATSVSLTAGRRFRAVITWDNDPNYVSYASRPSADLDLQIISPSGTVVASSVSYDNTYEIVDFTPSTSGVYKIRVKRLRCDYSPRWLGWAWYRL